MRFGLLRISSSLFGALGTARLLSVHTARPNVAATWEPRILKSICSVSGHFSAPLSSVQFITNENIANATQCEVPNISTGHITSTAQNASQQNASKFVE